MVEYARDILAVCAVGSIGYGLWWMHPAAAFIGVGGIVLAGLVLRRKA